ncbi:hypothetical protein R8Z50_26420 [Longispora sp. K20-0274]|uniref:hypothetical protein n=1 Tax=Longispora sp. K20-0274 TaxID=3088255 RepID=UPI00399B3227
MLPRIAPDWSTWPEQNLWCVAAMCSGRVGAVLAPYFDARSEYEASFAPIQVVEAVWRELAGVGHAEQLHSDVEPVLRQLADDLDNVQPSADAAAVAAIRAAVGLVAVRQGRHAELLSVFEAASSVAQALDHLGVRAPDGHTSWHVFESAYQQEDLDVVGRHATGDFEALPASMLRLRTAKVSLHYRRAMQEILVAG